MGPGHRPGPMDLHSVMLTLHIIAGSVALLTMVMAYVTKKGPKPHAKIGRVYGMAMVAVGLTAAILFFLGASTFLLLIAFFSTYLVLVGWRFAKNRRGDIGAVDRWLLIMGAVGGIGLSAMAAWIGVPLGCSSQGWRQARGRQEPAIRGIFSCWARVHIHCASVKS